VTRWVLSIVAAALTAGAMAAGAWALTSSDDVPAAPAKRPAVHRLQSDAAYSGERPCGRKHRSEAAKASVRY
jgi:hypothetical protein